MKSLSYTLAVLLPLASQLVVAMPGAEPDVGYLEERNKGSDWGYKNHHGDDDHHEYDNQNVCEVKYPYPYYKYPCDSSPSNGTSILGATFTSFCKYQWVLNHSQFPLGLLTKVIETPILESGTALQKDGSRKTISLESAVCNLLLTDTRKYTNRNFSGRDKPMPCVDSHSQIRLCGEEELGKSQCDLKKGTWLISSCLLVECIGNSSQ